MDTPFPPFILMRGTRIDVNAEPYLGMTNSSSKIAPLIIINMLAAISQPSSLLFFASALFFLLTAQMILHTPRVVIAA